MELPSNSRTVMADILQSLLELFPDPWLDPSMADGLAHVDRQLTKESRKSLILPRRESIFAALQLLPSKVRVVVLGQDPYPTPGFAIGRAFAVPKETLKLPPSLRNIFDELKSDLGIETADPSLATWQAQGVLLLNRILTVSEGAPLSHKNFGWQSITERIVKRAADHGAVGLLWGREAAKLEHLFQGRAVISAHPSPLSAHRGFFGSKPFSKVDSLLEKPIRW